MVGYEYSYIMSCCLMSIQRIISVFRMILIGLVSRWSVWMILHSCLLCEFQKTFFNYLCTISFDTLFKLNEYSYMLNVLSFCYVTVLVKRHHLMHKFNSKYKQLKNVDSIHFIISVLVYNVD